MSDDEETALVVLSRLDGEHTPEATEIDADCGCRSWIGPSMTEFIAKREAAGLETTTKCMPCYGGVEAIREAGREGTLRSTQGVRDEIAAAMGDRRGDILLRLLGAKDMK